ncbi:helix-turn-helix domain-containing protein [Klebsiella aerogenes]|uniref:helix-turn-helix domain-containing protein n=1 Tax=Klebsiella aerogenes TaxID=548 RepID=UPI001BD64647|nr:helix-turn-helix domain-containing protein [Klebsiella aerogenes]
MPSSFYVTENIYSETDFSSLKMELLKIGRRIQFTKGTVIQPRDNEILIVISGQMNVSDNSEGGLAVGHTFPFLPIGLIEHHFQLPLYYQAESQVAIVQVTMDEFEQIFYSNPEYSKLLSYILTFLSTRLIHIYYERNNDSGYATIREMLQRYLYKAEEGSLNNEGIAAFILKRTRLSRSYVFQILAGLKAGEYITVRNGKLISINRDIPERF